MKILPTIAALCGALLLSGCESRLPDDVRTALAPREDPHVMTFQADQKAVYAAALSALKEMDYTFVRGGPAQGELVALSRIGEGDDAQGSSSRQISLKAHMTPSAETGTDVEVALTEIIEADSANEPGRATESPLRDTPLYDVFFKDIKKALADPAGHISN
jgi:hypothetical protein